MELESFRFVLVWMAEEGGGRSMSYRLQEAMRRLLLWSCVLAFLVGFIGGYVAGQKAAPRFACACDQREAR